MNFNQFRWPSTIGRYELTIPRPDFVRQLDTPYAMLIRELQDEDRLFPDEDPSPLRDAGYPPLDAVLDNPHARFEAFEVFLYEDVFAAFIPFPPSPAAQFMINSIHEIASTPDSVIIRGRGYHLPWPPS